MTTPQDGVEDRLHRLWNIKKLPDPEFARDWDRILETKPIKSALLNYASLTKDVLDAGISRADLDLSGLVLLKGAPGTGKTTLAKGFSNVVATALGTTTLFTLRTQNVFSEWLGRSAKELGKAFAPVHVASEQGPSQVDPIIRTAVRLK